MILSEYFSPEVYTWIVLPLFIFIARILDVTLGTIRIVFLSRGQRALAPLLGFFEVLIWITVIGQVVQNLSSFISYFAYAAGFAAGNWVGLWIENKLAMGMLAIRMILVVNVGEMTEALHAAGYGVTVVQGEGSTGPVWLLFTVIKRRDLPEVVQLIKQVNPKTFFSIEEVRSASEGIFPRGRSGPGFTMRGLARLVRK